jgi:hypothetical protein
MPRDIVTTVYTYDELSDKAKERARDWSRNDASDDPYWGAHILDDAKDRLKELGWHRVDIYYSGFSSQGDGALFVGEWSADTLAPLALILNAPRTNLTTGEDIPGNEPWHAALSAYESAKRAGVVSGESSRRNHRYSHENCVGVEITFDTDDCVMNAEQQAVFKSFVEASRELMRHIYRTLMAEYDYQNSDEQVAESIIANEYEFTIDGKRA